LIEENLDKVDWNELCTNPNAVYLLEKNFDKINWWYLCKNPDAIHLLATLDCDKMREQCKEFASELLAYVLHPTRLIRLAASLDMDLEEYMELLI